MNILKTVITGIIIIIFLSHNSFSQENSIYHNYLLSPFLINPAITGSEYYPSVEIFAKKQWIGISDSPGTVLIAGNYRIGEYDFYNPSGMVNKGFVNLKDRIGLGAALFGDHNGPSNILGGLLSYAYHVPVTNYTRLSFGVSLSTNYYYFNNSKLKPDMPGDSYLLSGNENVIKANVNLGTYFYSSKFFTGVSVTKILPDMTTINDKVEEQPSIFFIGGYKFFHTKPNNFEQTIIIKSIKNEKLYADFLSKYYYQRLNWIAFSYSTSGKMNFLLGIHLIKMLYMGYNFEYTLSKISTFGYTTHGIYLGINLGLVKVENIKKTIN